MSHFVIKLSHFVTPVSVQPCLGDRMQDFSVHAGNKYLPKVKNPFGLNRPGDATQPFLVSSRNAPPHKRLLKTELHSFPFVFVV